MMKLIYEKSQIKVCDDAPVTDYLPPLPCSGKDGPRSLRNGKGNVGMLMYSLWTINTMFLGPTCVIMFLS